MSKVGSLARHLVLALGLLTVTLLPVSAATWWVSASAGSGGNGSQAKPYTTIGAAVTASAEGDTINVETGTYPEAVALAKNTITLQNYNGERAIVSGMGSLAPPGTVWSTYSQPTEAPPGSVYTTTVNSWQVRDLYGNFSRDQLSRAPSAGLPWVAIQSVSNSGSTYTVTVPTLGINFTTGVQSAFVDIFESHTLNLYLAYYISSISDNGTTCTITFTATGTDGPDIAVGDTLAVCNHPSLIAGPFDFAYQDNGSNQTTIYVDPSGSDNLNHAQSSKLNYGITVTGSGDIINGIEIAGFTNYGIRSDSSTNLLVENCLIHDNGFGESWGGVGVYLLNGTNATIKNCCIIDNYAGISDGGSNGITITQCEIALNDNDGIDVSGDNNTNPIDIDHCYIHNQTGLTHPDDLQFDNNTQVPPPGTLQVTLDSNFFTLGGGGIMSQVIEGVTLKNNIICGIGGRNVAVGNFNNITDWSTNQNTFAFTEDFAICGGGTGTFKDFSVQNSIFFHASYNYTGQTASDYNFFWAGNINGNPEDPIIATAHKYYLDPTGSELGLSDLRAIPPYYEIHSNGGATVFNNAPYFQGQVESKITASTRTSVIVDAPLDGPSNIGRWNPGDVVEFNGDGVARTISASTVTATEATITFSPALPTVPERFLIVWDWPAGTTNLKLDLSLAPGSLALTGSSTGSLRGSTVNTLNYEQGIFSGTTRNIPVVPSEVNYGESWAYPYNGLP